MAEYTLYCFAQSGNSYKVALMLELCGADWTPRFVDYFNGETRTPAYRAINVMGEAPVLETADGLRLSQSGVILDTLAGRLGRFGPRDEAERRETLRWLLFDNHKLTANTATLRYLLQFTDSGETPVTAFLRQRMLGALEVLAAHLADGRAFMLGNEPSIVDFSCCGYLFFNTEFGVDWNDFQPIGDWLERLRALPGWKHPYDLMPGHPLPARPGRR